MKIATVNGSPKIDIKLYVHTQDANIRMKIYMLKMFHKNYIYAHEMFGSREFRTNFWGRAKSICGPLIEVNTMCLAKKIS